MHQGVDRFFREVCGLEAGEVFFSTRKFIITKGGSHLCIKCLPATVYTHKHMQTHRTKT